MSLDFKRGLDERIKAAHVRQLKVDLPDFSGNMMKANPHWRQGRHNVSVMSHPDGPLQSSGLHQYYPRSLAGGTIRHIYGILRGPTARQMEAEF